MPGLGTLVNVVAILVGGALGLLLKKALSERLTETVMQGLGLAVLVVGFSGVFTSSISISGSGITFENTLLMILSLALGALIGAILNIEERLESVSRKLSSVFRLRDSADFSEGFVATTLLFTVGSMAILGSLEDGINLNPDILLVKSALDLVSAMVFAGTFGAGVLLSAVSVGVYQGLITALALFLSGFLTDAVISQMTLIGSVLIVGLSFNILKLAKIKVSNLLPAIFIPLLYYAFRVVTGL
ncbi:MAG: DUF554 domain-containing protein [Oscillospiraceae bacterium]|nr:DUF554 domain-containing protein [Oscillospiraceae bacterium]